MEKEIKGYSAVFDNQDGSFDFICYAKTEDECRKKACAEYDNERVRVYPFYDSPLEVL